MPSIDGEDSGDEEVEKSFNEDENMSEDEDEDDTSSSGSDDSSSDSVDEHENERRRSECLGDMNDLERQFSELKEHLYKERISQVDSKLEEVKSEIAAEYTQPLAELKEMCVIRVEVAGILRNCKIRNVNNKYDADEQAAVQHFESEKRALMDSMKAELEEKIRKLEEDKHNMDISADLWLESRSVQRKHRRTSEGVPQSEKRRKPVTVSGPYIVYMLKDMDILEDWAAIRKAKGALMRRKAENIYQSERCPYNAKYEDGKLYYEGEWFDKGSSVIIDNSREDTHSRAVITGINTGEVLLRRNDGSKAKLYIGHLQKGKFRIQKT